MVQKDKILLTEFESGLNQLIEYSDSLKSKNASLKRELAEKEATIKELIIKTEQLKKKYNNLQFAKSYQDSNQEDDGMTQQARERLSKLVQDVDKCIAMLKS